MTRKRKFLFYSAMLLLPVFVFVLGYATYTVYRSARLYYNIKTSQRGWTGVVHVADSKMGFIPIPHARGAETFPIGAPVAMRYDEDGFRAPLEPAPPLNPRPLVLALGCSFTYGAATHAKDTYPVLVGQSLEGTSKNAGVCSYGLSQMLLLAEQLVPIYRPDYLLVQYSSWLLNRARNPFAPSFFGKVPAPFFYDEGTEFGLQSPVFLTRTMNLPFDRYRNKPPGVLDALSFFWNAALPLWIHDDWNMVRYGIRQTLGIVPPPTDASERLIAYVYGAINEIAKAYGAQVIIVLLAGNADPVAFDEELLPPDALVVNAQEALLRRLSDPSLENYRKEYSHWRGSPPENLDNHPNEAAHRGIADAIVSAIANQPEQPSPQGLPRPASR